MTQQSTNAKPVCRAPSTPLREAVLIYNALADLLIPAFYGAFASYLRVSRKRISACLP